MVTDKGPRWNAGEVTDAGEVKEVELRGLAACGRAASKEWGAQTVLTFTPGWLRAATEDWDIDWPFYNNCCTGNDAFL